LRERAGGRSETAAPSNVFRIRDGRFNAISASTQMIAGWLFPRAICRADMIAHPRFRTNSTGSGTLRPATRGSTRNQLALIEYPLKRDFEIARRPWYRL